MFFGSACAGARRWFASVLMGGVSAGALTHLMSIPCVPPILIPRRSKAKIRFADLNAGDSGRRIFGSAAQRDFYVVGICREVKALAAADGLILIEVGGAKVVAVDRQ